MNCVNIMIVIPSSAFSFCKLYTTAIAHDPANMFFNAFLSGS